MPKTEICLTLEEAKEKWPEIPLGRAVNLKEKIFNRLTCLYKTESYTAPSGKKYTKWVCRCKCGNYVSILAQAIKDGSTKSCGCLATEQSKEQAKKMGHSNLIDLTGQRFGKLVVIQRDGEKRFKNLTQPTWLCKCDCGNYKIVTGVHLKNGDTCSCGCIGNSKNNIFIEQNLKKLNFFYEKEKIIIIEDRKLKADFFINNKYIIEYDGEQHFRLSATSAWKENDGSSKLIKTRERDLIKNKYCFDNNIPIIRIPYDADYTIDDLKLETTRFLLTPENEKEYYESRA